MKKIGRITTVLLIAITVSFSGFADLNSAHTVEAKTTSGDIVGSTSVGNSYRDGEVGFQAGCALSELLGLFKCHDSMTVW